jgi:hypothetical protein
MASKLSPLAVAFFTAISVAAGIGFTEGVVQHKPQQDLVEDILEAGVTAAVVSYGIEKLTRRPQQ